LLTVSRVQYALLDKWAAGEFIADWPDEWKSALRAYPSHAYMPASVKRSRS
jgi:hypothetical protein